jgi:hypothetical protein
MEVPTLCCVSPVPIAAEPSLLSHAYHITDEHIGLNLGGVIGKIIHRIKYENINTVLISVMNNTWYGMFTVPSAVGFSTPVSLLKGAYLQFSSRCTMPKDTLIVQYNEWAMNFSGTGVRHPEKNIMTSDKITCDICTEDYRVGDEVYSLDSCGHMFHQKCINDWIMKQCEMCEHLGVKSFKFHCAHTASTLHISATKCPLCNKETNV